MSEKRLDNAEERLDCKKKYLYEHSMFWECNDGCKCQILEDDVVDLLNERDRKIRQLEKSIERREEQISIIKKHCKTYLTEEQYKTIKEALSVN